MDSTLACLTTWMPRQRWYAGGGHTPVLSLVAQWDAPVSDPNTRVFALLVEDTRARERTVYHVPLVERRGGAPHPGAIIGVPREGWQLVDGASDPAYTEYLLTAVTTGETHRTGDVVITGLPTNSGVTLGSPIHTHVLTGEQSNTSIIYRFDAHAPIVCKIFRIAQAGTNPDIELTEALSAHGSTHVPRAVGSLIERADDLTHALVFAEEFLEGSEDAWRVALRAAQAGEDFRERATALGVATAEVHADLADLFPTVPADDARREDVAASWRTRLDAAVADAPVLAQWRDRILEVYSSVSSRQWPPLQRIHGDYHLGQVIETRRGEWVLLDFEGEPLRPLSERVRPDSAVRDVAGMLRSFDYVAATVTSEDTGTVRRWAQAARDAFLAGYTQRSGAALDQELVDAFELDKALYETSYESHQRPDWIGIPLSAVERLVTASGGARSA